MRPTMSRRAAIAGITLALVSEGDVTADEGFDYYNADYPPVAPVDGQCPDGYAYDFQRGDRCVSMIGWCNDRLWSCAGKPERRHHPQFRCDPTRKRPPRSVPSSLRITTRSLPVSAT